MRLIIARHLAVVLLLTGGLSLGCRNPVTSAGITMESYPGNTVKVNSRVFGRHFRVAGSALAKGDNDLLRATISLESLKNESLPFEFRFRWIDEDGIEVTSGTTIWIQRVAGARETVLLSGIAPTRRAADFILDMRFVYPSTRWR